MSIEAINASSARPRFSIVSAVYNVAPYLDDFIESVEAQAFPLDNVEVIMVNDGSTDDSLRRLEDWRSRRPSLVRVLSKPNGGQASARNLGLAHASGEWITFPDPDDTLSSNYLIQVDRFLNRHPTTELVATNRRVVHEATGTESAHPLHLHFARNRLLNLNEHPTFFHGSAPAAFFRRDVLQQQVLEFDERIRPNFEDGHFCVNYLLRSDAPLVGFVRTAKYFYRKRADGSSTLNTGRANPRRFTDVLEFGYLDVLRQSQRRLGRVPEWLQNFVLYELSWYFQDEESMARAETAAFDDVATTFHRLLKRIAAFLEPSVIRGFSVRRFDPVWREILLDLSRTEPWHTPFVLVDSVDSRQKLVRVIYRYSSDLPHERFFSDGIEVKPAYSKVRGLRYFDRIMLHERIAWLPLGNIRVMLNHQDVDVRLNEPARPVHSLSADSIRTAHDPLLKPLEKPKTQKRESTFRKLSDDMVLRLAQSPAVRLLFKDAWVLMDRIDNADDSAEHVFRYLRRKKRNINAWFVLAQNTPDYERLRRDGFVRLIPHGSLLWKLLMLNAKHLISSHADVQITRPPAILKYTKMPTWRFTFLQHGVIKDDLSNWLNPKRLDLFITSTPAEHRSIVADGTTYRYTEREVKLTGLPRFDRLLEVGELVPPDRRDYLLIAPTWRNWLEQTDTVTKRRKVDHDTFVTSDFAANWLGLINSAQLRHLAVQHHLTVAVLLHPNLQALTSSIDVPPWVTMLRFAGQDVQQTFARARVLITDYSSMAFNAAYIERAVVYFQFDRERVFHGGHLGRRGYFDYERDGFGPVALTLGEAIDALTSVVSYGPMPQPEYLRRIREAFPMRDGKCCERVVEVIRESTRKVPRTLAETDADVRPLPTVADEFAVVELRRSVGLPEFSVLDGDDDTSTLSTVTELSRRSGARRRRSAAS